MTSVGGNERPHQLPLEPCPKCGLTNHLRTKLLLIDERWRDEAGKDPRLKYFTDLRVDSLEPEFVKDAPFEQFVDGFYCDLCAEGFISHAATKEVTRYHLVDGRLQPISNKDRP